MGEEKLDDWSAECSNDESYKLEPNDIIELYEKISRGENLELDWKCFGRRSPTPELRESVEIKEEADGESVTEQKVVVAEFDFDEASSGIGIITPRRSSVGGGKTPRSNQKRVAQLDKIMNDMRRYRKLDEESRKNSEKAEGSSHRPRKASPKTT